ncbi:hypothetical protein [Dyella mobilis]|uniref:Peptidase M61 catalytic domain-containing protein n=1 Tax=Dyella mobilis TaxID=1849582 RepID=A0ABS2KF97_9GAMM|nr:hypothetical protein [Dyella mobilis]MBM7129550.1 hypothetical protein [Dyella mobilis]GLQ98187.1 hypothetical protein GCM10007863_26070 [Dyella mobilis]
MNKRIWLLSVTAIFLLIAKPVLADAPCVDADIRITPDHKAVLFKVNLPNDVRALRLADFDGYRRSQLWLSEDDSATVTDAALTPTHARSMQASMNVSENLDRIDRVYPPFLRFSDGTVAVDSALYRANSDSPSLCAHFIPAPGEEVAGFGTVTTKALTLPPQASSGYVAFGTPRIDRRFGVTIVSDRGIPAWALDQVARAIPHIAHFYSNYLGPITLPTVFFYSQPSDSADTDYHGERLPESITLGLIGNGWRQPDTQKADKLIAFVAHEVFHAWNAANGMHPADDESNLAVEGGAEFAKILATAEQQKQNQSAWWAGVSDALNRCLLELPTRGSLSDGHLGHGMLPYDCGVPVMLVIGAANDPQRPGEGFFLAWKQLIQRKRDATDRSYRWTDLVMSSADPKIVQTLEAAVRQDQAYSTAIVRALNLAGFKLQPVSNASSEEREAINGKWMAAFMAQDCHGRISFWKKPNGFLLDHPLPSCSNLSAGKIVVSLAGEAFATSQPPQLASAIYSQCATGHEASAAYDDGSSASLACPVTPPVLPQFVEILAYKHP